MPRLVPSEAWRPRGIEELEPNADWAARTGSNALIVAGPGAGKTELLAQRACFLLETGTCPHPKRILAISFKRDAARNLRERVLARSGWGLARRFDSFTFDAFAKALLDQFSAGLPAALRPTSNYDVLPGGPREAHVGEILRRMDPPRPLGRPNDLLAFESERFYKEVVLTVSFDDTPLDLETWAAREYWRLMLHGQATSSLYFPMIARLAGELARLDERVARAYRSTYTHVFLDEFQDTTSLQYWLTCALFEQTDAVLTAVGDAQQRIMVWAGAARDVFTRYTEDFTAEKRRLERNRRASTEIAPIVAYLAARLREEYGEGNEEAAIEPIEPGGPPPEAFAAYLFEDASAEAKWLAQGVRTLLDADIAPREICILVRMKAAEYAAPCMAALSAAGISCRLEEAMQDLLTEPAVVLSILCLRALLGKAPGPAWAELRNQLADLQGVDTNDDAALAQVDITLQELRRTLRKTHRMPPSDASRIRKVLSDYIEPLFRVPLRNRYAQYTRGSFYEDQLGKLCLALSECSAPIDWDVALAHVEGHDAIPVLTIHKSKGLEYDAVFFVGLEDSAFWNFRRAPDEELNTFFVALSRAKKRVAFTFAAERDVGRRSSQSRREIRQVYDLLEEAGVPIVDLRARG